MDFPPLTDYVLPRSYFAFNTLDNRDGYWIPIGIADNKGNIVPVTNLRVLTAIPSSSAVNWLFLVLSECGTSWIPSSLYPLKVEHDPMHDPDLFYLPREVLVRPSPPIPHSFDADRWW